MTLNNHSFVHLQIRKLCSQLEFLAGMKLVTDINGEFNDIRLINNVGYITIDWKKNACYTLSHHLNDIEIELVKTIMLYLNWLETGEKVKRIKAKNL